MKNPITLLVLFSFWGFQVQAQNDTIPNSSFENWQTVSQSGQEDPVGWKSTNVLNEVGAVRGIRRSTDAYQGNYSLEVFPIVPDEGKDTSLTVTCIGNPNSSEQIEYLRNGGIVFKKDGLQIVSGFYKFNPNQNSFDSVYALAYTIDYTMGFGRFYLSAISKGFSPATEWTPFSLKLKGLANPTINDGHVDTLVVVFYYKSTNKDPNNTGYFRVDQLGLDFTTGIDETEGDKGIQVFPNPAADGLFFTQLTKASKYSIYNALGQLVLSGTAGGELKIDLTNEPAGAYFLEVIQDEKSSQVILLKQ